MEYHINEKRLIELVERFLNIRKKSSVVCDYMVDYDFDFDRLVVNIFFKKDTNQAHAFLIQDKLIEDITNFFKLTPFVYTHVGDC